MQDVSDDYLTANAAAEREMVTRVEICFVDNETLGSAVTASGDEIDSLVGVENAIDGRVTQSRDMAFADPVTTPAFPGDPIAVVKPGKDLFPCTEEAGWWGDSLSDDNGDLPGAGETLTLEYSSAIDVRLIQIYFPRLIGPIKDFEVEYWDGSAWQTIVTVTGNRGYIYEYELSSAVNTTKVRLTATKVYYPKHPAGVLEFSAGFTENVTDRVAYWDIKREREGFGSRPAGNVNTAELNLELDNSDGVWFRNSGSQYAAYLDANRKIRVWSGVTLADGSEEMVPLGEFYTRSWKSKESEVITRVTAWDRSKKMKEEEFSTSDVYVGKRIDELVETVADAFGIDSADLRLDTSGTVVDYAWFEKQSYWACLAALAMGEGGNIYFDGDGKLVFEKRGHLDEEDTSVATLTDLNLLSDIEEAWEQDRLRNEIIVPVRPLTKGAEEEICKITDTITVPAGDTKSLTVFFKNVPCVEVQTPSITGGPNCSVDDWTAYAWGGTLVLANAGGSDEEVTEITIDGKPLEELGGLEATEADDTSIDNNGRRTYEVPEDGSRFIQNLDLAETMASELKNVLSDPGAEIKVSGRGRPELQISDRVTIQDTKLSIDGDYWILRMTLKYDGGMSEAEYTLLEAS